MIHKIQFFVITFFEEKKFETCTHYYFLQSKIKETDDCKWIQPKINQFLCHQPHKKRKIRNVKPTSQSKKKYHNFFSWKKKTQQLLLQIIFSVTWSKPALSEIQTLPILFFVHPNRNIRTSRIEGKKILETKKKK